MELGIRSLLPDDAPLLAEGVCGAAAAKRPELRGWTAEVYLAAGGRYPAASCTIN
jgi:hypothetical protein